MPALRQAWVTFRGLPSMMRGKGIRGIPRQVWKIVNDSCRATVEEIARKLTIPKDYAAAICKELSKSGRLMRTADEQGYAPAEEQEREVLKLAELLRTFSDGDISARLEIAPDRAAEICRALHRHIVAAPDRTYVLRKDLDAAREAIAAGEGIHPKEIAGGLGIPPAHARLLCECLVRDGYVVKGPQGAYLAPKEDVSRLLRLVESRGCVPKSSVGGLLGLGRDYARTLCASTVEDGYLRVSPDGQYLHPARATTGTDHRQQQG